MINLNATEQVKLWAAISVGNAVGNAFMLRGIYQESHKVWDRSVMNETGKHLIAGKLNNDGAKTQAIMDYALQISMYFDQSKYPTGSLLTKHSFNLNTEIRKAVLYQGSSRQFDTNKDLFYFIATELLCFENSIVDIALNFDDQTQYQALAMYTGSLLGDIKSEEDYNIIHNDVKLAFQKYGVLNRREEFVNECIQYITSHQGGDEDLYDIILKVAGTK